MGEITHETRIRRGSLPFRAPGPACPSVPAGFALRRGSPSPARSSPAVPRAAPSRGEAALPARAALTLYVLSVSLFTSSGSRDMVPAGTASFSAERFGRKPAPPEPTQLRPAPLTNCQKLAEPAGQRCGAGRSSVTRRGGARREHLHLGHRPPPAGVRAAPPRPRGRGLRSALVPKRGLKEAAVPL